MTQELKKYVILGCTLISGCFIVLFMFIYCETSKDNSYISTYFFNLNTHQPIIIIILRLMSSLVWTLITAKINCFILYYCVLCKLLRKMFNHYNNLLHTETEYAVLLQKFNNMIETLSIVDGRFSALIFFSCLLSLNEIFIAGYNIAKSNFSFLSYYLAESIWLGFVFFYLVVEASFVNKSIDKIQYTVKLREKSNNSLQDIRFVTIVCSSDARLTIWMMIVMRRMTILTVTGTFITYSFLIAN